MRKQRIAKLIATLVLFCSIGVIVAWARLNWAERRLVAIKSTISRDLELGFGPVGKAETFGRLVHDRVPWTKNFDRDAFDIAFRPVEEVQVWYFGDLRGDLGAELAKFHGVRKLELVATERLGPTATQWGRLARQLSTLTRLEEIGIGGSRLTPEVIRKLSTAPALRKVVIFYGAPGEAWESLNELEIKIEFETRPEDFDEV